MTLTEALDGLMEHVPDHVAARYEKEIMAIYAAIESSGVAQQGSWPANDIRRAFVDVAKWWEWQMTGSTMFPDEVDRAESEADKRYARPEAPRITEAEAAQFLDDGFAIKVINAAPADGRNQGRNYWRCPHCQMADFDGHEQSCVIRALVERLLGRHVPFGQLSIPSPQLRLCNCPGACKGYATLSKGVTCAMHVPESIARPQLLSCPDCGHSNTLNGRIVHGPICPAREPQHDGDK